eukprot:Nk52_evm3s2415 gene=Nk52_evmTU3s2415
MIRECVRKGLTKARTYVELGGMSTLLQTNGPSGSMTEADSNDIHTLSSYWTDVRAYDLYKNANLQDVLDGDLSVDSFLYEEDQWYDDEEKNSPILSEEELQAQNKEMQKPKVSNGNSEVDELDLRAARSIAQVQEGLLELYISYKDTKLSNDRRTRVAIEEKMLKSVKDGEEASTVDIGDWIYANFTGDNGSEIGLGQEMRKKNASGKT